MISFFSLFVKWLRFVFIKLVNIVVVLGFMFIFLCFIYELINVGSCVFFIFLDLKRIFVFLIFVVNFFLWFRVLCL